MKMYDFDFRIWHKEKGYFDEPAYIFYQFSVEKHFDEILRHRFFNEVEVELWSGLKDCKGRKIFEGDIIKNIDTKAEYRVYFQENFFLFPVKYKEGGLERIFLISEVSDILYLFEIVGNIHNEEERLWKK